jgi:phage-related protein
MYSGDMGVISCSLSSGLYEDDIGANRNIIEQTNNQTDRRYFNRIQRDPYEFELNLLLEEGRTDEQIQSIFKWLLNDYYEELYFEDEVDRVYYCLPISQPKLFHNGLNQGYITIQMRCYDSYLYSREITSVFELSSNPVEGSTITLSNDGHTDILPFITILAKESTIKLQNLVTNEVTQFTGLNVGETITLDNENEEITTNVVGEYRFSNHNDVFVRILPSGNQFKVNGKCVLTFKYRYRSKY